MDIVLAVLPLLVVSAVVVAIIQYCKKKYQVGTTGKTDDNNGNLTNTSKKRSEGKRVAYGLSIGMCIGAGIGLSLLNFLGINALVYGGCFGMLTGLFIGIVCEKTQTSNNVK